MRLPSESSASSVVPELVELPPYLGGVYRGNVYSDLKQYDKAIADYSDYIRPRPNDPEATTIVRIVMKSSATPGPPNAIAPEQKS